MVNIFTKIFGTKSERDIKALRTTVQRIERESARLQNVSDDELRRAVQPIRDYIPQQMKEVQERIDGLKVLEQTSDSIDVYDREAWIEGVEKLNKINTERLQIVLTEMLPLAFAIMRETAKRLATNKKLVVTAEPFDQEIAARSSYVTIEGDKAIWSNQWEAAGTPVVWDMAYYDVQMLGGIILHQGKIAEMATGEGKTLVATLPAFLNALAGKGVHIVTVNDYLAKRDAEWMGPLFEFHGLRVDCIDKHAPHSPERKQAYQADITYGTNNEFGFDYLRDNMVSSPEELVQREPFFAMIDEVDSVLIDDARTPLIISGPVEDSNEQEYSAFQPRIQKLYEKQKALVTQFLQDAKKKIAEGNEEEGGLALFRAHRGLPKHKPLVRYLSETGIKKIMHKVENYYLQDNSRMMPEADAPLLFVIEERNGSIELTEKGIEYITKAGEDTDFFVLPDIGVELSNLNGKFTSEEEELIAKQTLAREYNEKAQRIHVVQQLLKAYALFEKDVEYIVVDRKVKLVDEQTGRVLEGRRYSDGLHQALEAKEGVKVEKATQTYATVTLQNYFRMYRKLAGMTGTAITEAGEFWDIYELDVVETPTHKPIAREDLDDKVYKTTREKFNAVIEEVAKLSQQGRPVLVGTTSVEVSELVSRMLTMKKIKHQVLNAKHHQKEAQIVAEAGKAGTVTIATNMAGRGTDIKLTPEARLAGGLAIIGTERHESRRVDRQLRGRSGRQGDVGSSQFFVSLEDSLMRLFGSDRIVRVMDQMGLQEGEVIQHPLITKSIERAQKKVEQNNFSVRKRLLQYDDVMNSHREVIYKRRKHALLGNYLESDAMSMIHNTSSKLTSNLIFDDKKELRANIYSIFGHSWADRMIQVADELTQVKDPREPFYTEAVEVYRLQLEKIKRYAASAAKKETEKSDSTGALSLTLGKDAERIYISVGIEQCIETSGTAFAQAVERAVTLHFIDKYWKEHLREMDQLRQSVQNAVYERRDPLVTYQFEAYTLFKELCSTIDSETISFMYRHRGLDTSQDFTLVKQQQNVAPRSLEANKQAAHSPLQVDTAEDQEVLQPRKADKIASRNERVTVRYKNGTIKKGVKFKTIEEDLATEKCVLI